MINMNHDVTLAQLASDHGMQTHELAAFLDLGTNYADHEVLSPEFLASARWALSEIHIGEVQP